MNENALSEMTLEELKKKNDKVKILTAVLGGAIIVLVLAAIYLTIVKGFSVFSVFPVIFFPVLTVMIKGRKKIEEEIEKRGTL